MYDKESFYALTDEQILQLNKIREKILSRYAMPELSQPTIEEIFVFLQTRTAFSPSPDATLQERIDYVLSMDLSPITDHVCTEMVSFNNDQVVKQLDSKSQNAIKELPRDVIHKMAQTSGEVFLLMVNDTKNDKFIFTEADIKRLGLEDFRDELEACGRIADPEIAKQILNERKKEDARFDALLQETEGSNN